MSQIGDTLVIHDTGARLGFQWVSSYCQTSFQREILLEEDGMFVWIRRVERPEDYLWLSMDLTLK